MIKFSLSMEILYEFYDVYDSIEIENFFCLLWSSKCENKIIFTYIIILKLNIFQYLELRIQVSA